MSDGGPWIPFYPSDWLAGTRGLSAAETGVYITLISMMYERQSPLPPDRARLARVCGCARRNFDAALDVLIGEGKIVWQDGGLWNCRVQTELLKRQNRSVSAQKSANARWEKNEQNQTPDDATASSAQCDRNAHEHANHSHIPESEETPNGVSGARARATSPPAPKSRDGPRGSRLPDDWQPTEADIDTARSEGMTDDDIRRTADKFRDYWLAAAGQRARKCDWAATWRNWIRSERDRAGAAGGRAGAAAAGGNRRGPTSFAEAAMRVASRGTD